jgi:hypothetical protein
MEEKKNKNVSRRKSVSKNVPKKPLSQLSVEDQEDLEKKRQIFRDLHNCFAKDEIFDAEAGLSELQGLIEGMFQVWQDKIKVKDLNLEDEITEKKKYILEVLGECTVAESIMYTSALRNAIDQHKYRKLKGLKVEGLDIKLL